MATSTCPTSDRGASADYILIAMEPSLGRWAPTAAKAAERLADGFQNFLWSIEDFILHHAIRSYLCQGGESYHLTDLSKGAMLVAKAADARHARYQRWHALLCEEIRLVAKPTCQIFAIGTAVDEHLSTHGFPWPYRRLIHYSGQAGRARKHAVKGHTDEFLALSEQMTIDDILRTAQLVFAESTASASLRAEISNRLSRTALTESRKRLLFAYRARFLGRTR